MTIETNDETTKKKSRRGSKAATASDAAEGLPATVKEALDVLRDPSGDGSTKVSHGFSGEPLRPVGGAKAEWEAAAAEAAETVVAARQDAMPPRRFEEMLPCKLTDEEKIQRGEQLSQALAVVDTITAERKQANDGFKARAELAMERVRELRDAVDSGTEERNVECIESFELRLNCARTVRVDTGEYIRERALKMSELQPELPLSNGENGHAQMCLGDVDPTDTTDPEALLRAAQQGDEDPADAPLDNDGSADDLGDDDSDDGEDDES
jgi:hypothetical protein